MLAQEVVTQLASPRANSIMARSHKRSTERPEVRLQSRLYANTEAGITKQCLREESRYEGLSVGGSVRDRAAANGPLPLTWGTKLT